MSALKGKLIALIRQAGPLTIAQYMAVALHDPRHGYYASAPKLGADGDFITAPEISQMFGEIIGAWCAQEWAALGRPDPFHLIELGPGTGALMSDILRTARKADGFTEALRVHLVEASAPLRAAQSARLSDAGFTHHDRLEDAPAGPCIILGNEFLDCLPIRQFVRDGGAWRERLVGAAGADLVFGLSPESLGDLAGLPAHLQDAPDGTMAEIAFEHARLTQTIARRLHDAPGRALFIDYGGDGTGDTLQALRAHQKIDPLAAPGECDLTARVDFAAFAAQAQAAGVRVYGPVAQGAWLKGLGIEARADALAKAHPARAARIGRELARLTHAEEMGGLFQVLCLSSPTPPAPAGF